jgi:hypothetical protein
MVKEVKRFKAAFGPQLWWGANPAYLLKYGKKLGKVDATVVYHEDINQVEISETVSSIAFPVPKTEEQPFILKQS